MLRNASYAIELSNGQPCPTSSETYLMVLYIKRRSTHVQYTSNANEHVQYVQ